MNWANILGFVGLALGAAGVIGGLVASEDRSDSLDRMVDARNRANAIETKKQTLTLRRQRLAAISKARKLRAASINRVYQQTSGAPGQSTVGAHYSVTSQLGGNLKYQNAYSDFTSQQSAFLRQSSIFGIQARQEGERTAMFQSFSGLGTTLFKNREDIVSIFPA